MGALGHHVGLTGSSAVYVVMIYTDTKNHYSKKMPYRSGNFKIIYNWLQHNNLNYLEMPEMSNCPTHIMFEDKADKNNTDEPENPDLESHIDYHHWFPSNGEPTKTTASYHTQQDFMKAYMEGKEPTLVSV